MGGGNRAAPPRSWREAALFGPRTVLEGDHGFYRAVRAIVKPDFTPLRRRARSFMGDGTHRVQGLRLRNDDAAVCRLRRSSSRTGVPRHDISEIVCEVGEGPCHRLWGTARGEARGRHNRTPQKFSHRIAWRLVSSPSAGFAQVTQSAHRRIRPGAGVAAKIRIHQST